MLKKITGILLLGSIASLLISNIATAAVYSYTTSPTSLPTTMVQGSAAIPVTITVTNTSGDKFGLGAPTVGSDSNWKELTNTCDVKVGLANGASCVITGLYSPVTPSTNSIVYLNATVAGNMSSHRPILSTVVVAGTGAKLSAAWTTSLPEATVTGAVYTAVLTVTNTGSTAVTLDTPVWLKTPAVDFPDTAAAGTCGATLAGGATCTYTETFKPLTESATAHDKSLNVVVNYNTSETVSPSAATTSTTKKLLVAVGGGPGNLDPSARILTSTDNGITWETQSYDEAHLLTALVATGEQFLAVGDDGDILSSSDATSWSTSSSGTTNDLTAGIWDNTQYLVYGVNLTNYTSNLLTSANGISWAAKSTTPASYIFSVLKRDDTYAALGINADLKTVFLTSSNGSSWTEKYNFNTEIGVYAVVPGQLIWTGTQYVMVGMTYDGATTFTGIIYTSPDGTTWTGHASGTTNRLTSINWNGTQYVAVGALGTVLTSPDALTWTVRQSNVSGTLNKITWNGSEYIAVGDGVIITSPDGIDWTTVENGTGSNLNSVAWDGSSRYVAVGGGVVSAFPVIFHANIVTSTDGTTWTAVTSLPTNFKLNSAAYGNGVFVAVGDAGTILKSDNGLTWSQMSPFTSNDLYGVTWSSAYNKFFAVGKGGKAGYSNATGTSWNLLTSGTSQDLHSIVESGGRCVAVGTMTGGAASMTITSADCATGTAWTATAIGGVVALDKVIADGSTFIAVGTNGNVYSTTDGTTWQLHTFPVNNIDLHAIAKLGSNYVVGGYHGVMYKGTSLDSWTQITNANQMRVLDLMSDGTKFIFVGNNGVIFSSLNATTWSRANIFNIALYDIHS